MSFNYPQSGLNNVAEYQASGLPYVTQSVATTGISSVEFPYVTNFFTVKNVSGQALEVGFTTAGLQGSNKFTVLPSSSISFTIRCRTLFVRSVVGSPTYEVVAGLTTIPRERFPALTQSLHYNSSSLEGSFGYPGI
jgi:hypothetical protein